VFEALGEELTRRGHRVTFLINRGAEQSVSPHFDVQPVEGTDKRRLDDVILRASRPGGPLGILRTVHDGAVLSEFMCRHAPAHIKPLGVDAILGDQMEPAAGLVARHLDLPLVSIACALPVERDKGIPLPFLSWPYNVTPEGERRNQGGERVARLLLSEQRRLIRKWAARFGLGGNLEDLQSCVSELATVAQVTSDFEFPRTAMSKTLHMLGPLRGKQHDVSTGFPVDPQKPFVFMSLGTLQGHRYRLFRAAATACQELGVQLLVAHCGGLSSQQAERLGATWVTDYAPQRAVLARADLCVTHGGLNTVMDALEFGTPLLALPIAFDQPGVAARVVHHDVGLRLSPRLVTVAKMKNAIASLLTNRGYSDRAKVLGGSIATAGGVAKAASIIEAAVARGASEARRPVAP
ncbi:MAG TPA: nucleotide disphospho-sugar-binding domain-containing protein, partial [Pseudorhizobium sp.]|nr:nucleotide disphospho-sugar-binding domain-containing protein [Pseudorhizobium sp.]